jgi:pyridoxamine 5'-phosphate oxidase
LLFHWKSLERQIRIKGCVYPISPAQADAYFASRPRESQIGTWASKQSMPMASLNDFEERLAYYRQEFEQVTPIPRPDHWSGFALKPNYMEFWKQKPFRLHERCIFIRQDDASWKHHYVYP